MLSRIFSRFINFFLRNCLKSSSSTSTDGSTEYSLRDLPDEFLDFLLDHNETMLKDEAHIEAHPEQVEKIQTHTENIFKEQHRRKLRYCLDEIRILQRFKDNKKEWVVRWLNRIDVDNIETLEGPALSVDPLLEETDEEHVSF